LPTIVSFEVHFVGRLFLLILRKSWLLQNSKQYYKKLLHHLIENPF